MKKLILNNISWMQTLLLGFIIAANITTVKAQLSGTVTVGTTGTYPTLTGTGGVFEDITLQGLNGNLTIQIVSDIVEDGTHALSYSGAHSIEIQPDGSTLRTISTGSAANMIRLSATNNVTIDGRNPGNNSTGIAQPKYLLFTSSVTGAASTIEFLNGSTNNTLQYLSIEGRSNSQTDGIIKFSAGGGGSGNSNNIVEYSIIRPQSGQESYYGIYSSSTVGFENTNNIIRYNDFDNNYSTLNYYASAIGLHAYTDNWEISHNSFFFSSAYTMTGGSKNRGFCHIRINAPTGNFTISNNYFGGSSREANGTLFYSQEGPGGWVRYAPIRIESADDSDVTHIFNNTFTNVDIRQRSTGSPTYTITLIFAGNGNYLIEDNHFGAKTDGTGTIAIRDSQFGMEVYGLHFHGTSVGPTIRNNVVRNINATSANASSEVDLYGIRQTNTYTSSPAVYQNNIITNLSNSGTSSIQNAVYGLYMQVQDGTVIEKNRIFNLNNVHSTGYTVGLAYDGSALAGNSYFQNNIISLGTSQTSDLAIYGIWDFSTGGITNQYWNNSVVITGSSGGSANSSYAFVRDTDAVIELKNNILFNNRSTATNNYAIGTILNTNWANSDNNLLYASNSATIGNWVGSATTLAGWQTNSAGDASSVTADIAADFTDIANADLNLPYYNISQPTVDKGENTTLFTDDFQGISRYGTYDIGAYEGYNIFIGTVGGSVGDWFSSFKWSGNTVPVCGDNVLIVPGGTFAGYSIDEAPTIFSNATNATFNELFIMPTANLTINSGGILEQCATATSPAGFHNDGSFLSAGQVILFGDLENNGSYTDAFQTRLNGTSDQYISGTSPIGFNQLFIDGGSNKYLQNSVDLNNQVHFTDGILHSDAINVLTFNASATINTGPSDASHVNGPVTKTGSADFTFPVGDGTNYLPIGIGSLSGSSSFRAEFFGVDPDGSYSRASKLASIEQINNNEYWQLDRTSGSSSATVNLSWAANHLGVSDINSLLVSKWDGGQWINLGNGGASGDVNTGSIPSNSAVSSFSPFALASTVQPPDAVDDSFATDIDVAFNDNVLTNDTDPGGYNLSVTTTPITAPSNGSLTLNANGDFTYIPNGGYTGSDSFTYEVCNDATTPQCSQATVSIMVMQPVFCNRNFYFGFNDPTDLNILNTSAEPYTFDLIRDDTEYYNALGVNPVDGYIYAVSLQPGTEGHIIKIDANGRRFDLGLPSGMPSAPAFYAGAFDRNGTYYVFQSHSTVSVPSNPDAKLLQIDVTTSPPTINSLTNYGTTHQISDIAVNPNDGKIYGYEQTVESRLAYIDPASPATMNFFGPTRPVGVRAGSVFFDEFGDFYAYANDTLAASTDQTFLYRIEVGVNGSGNGYFEEIGTGPVTAATDGCRCGFGIDILTSVSVDTSYINSTVTYTYSLINQSASAITMDLTDIQDEGRTFVNGSLTNPFGGTANAYGGSGTLTITGLTITSGGQGDITVQVNIPNNPSISTTLTNQPELTAFSVPGFTSTILSDNPATGIIPDATVLHIVLPPNAVDDSFTSDVDVALSDNVLTNDTDPNGNNLSVNTTPISGPGNGTLSLSANGDFTYTPSAGYTGSDSFTYEVCNDATTPQCSQATVNITVMQPFYCTRDFYFTFNDPSELNTLNTNVLPYTFNNLYTDSKYYSAIGLNPTDGYIYGISLDPATIGHVIKVGANGNTQDLGLPLGSMNTAASYWAGAFTADGTYFVFQNYNLPNNPQPRLLEIDITTSPPTIVNETLYGTIYSVGDIAVNPIDGMIYGFEHFSDERLFYLDPANPSTFNFFGPTRPSTFRNGSVFFDEFGTFYMYGEDSVSGNDQRFFNSVDVGINGSGTGYLTYLGDGPITNQSDGCRCGFGVDIKTTVSVDTTALNTIVSYTYSIINQSASAITMDFIDTQNEGRTFVNGTLTNPFGGTVNAYGGTGTLDINGLTVPSGTQNDITVQVHIPNDPLISPAIYNQPLLNNFSDPNLPASMLSDNPATGVSPDRTRLMIIYPPVASADSYTTNEDVAINDNVLVNDYDPEGDNMLVNTTPITDVTNGALVLNGDGTFTYTPNIDFSGSDSFVYEVCDDGTPSQCAQATASITINAVNDPPVAVDDFYTTDENTALNTSSPGVLNNDSDPETAITANLLTNVTQGTLTLNSNGSFDYSPNAGFSGTDSFTYEACDGSAVCTSATVTIQVLCTTRSVLDWSNYTALPTVNGEVLDAEGFTIRPSYVPDAITTDFRVESGGKMLVVVDPNTNTDVAVQKYKFDQTLEQLLITFRDIDSNCGGSGCFQDEVTINAYSSGAIYNLTNGDFTMGSTVNYLGSNQFRGIANSPSGSDIGNVNLLFPVPVDSIIVEYTNGPDAAANPNASAYAIDNPTWCNNPPVVLNEAYTISEDDAVANFNVAANDSDPDGNFDLATISIVTPPDQGGSAIALNDGTIDYAPAADFNGTETLTYQICDGGGLCDQVTVTFTVSSVNDSPLAVHNTFTTLMNASVNGNLIDNDSDPEGNNLSLTTTPVSGPSQGTVTLNTAGTFTYTPNAGFTGLDQFEYEVCDDGTPSACATQTVYVRAVCDTRSTLDWDNYPLNYNPDGILLEPDSFGVTLNLRDPYAEMQAFEVTDIFTFDQSLDWLMEYSDASHYTEVSIQFDQPVNYLSFRLLDIDRGSVGGHKDSIEVMAYSGGSLINLQPENYNTGISNKYIGNNQFAGTDLSDFDETFGDIRLNFSVAIDSVVIRHQLPFLPGGSYTYGLSIHDLSWCNALPSASDDAYTVNEDDPAANFDVSANDNDSDGNFAPSTISIFTAPDQGGTATAQPDGTIDYAPTANFNGTETLVYQICDGGGLCDQATVTYTVNSVNDAPVANDDATVTDEDVILNGDVLANDTDPELDLLTVNTTPVADVSNGTLILNGDGTYTYTPNADFNGSDSFTYEVCDNGSPVLCDQATVTITVNPVNDAPVAIDDSYTTPEDTPLSDDVRTNDSDIDLDGLFVTTTPVLNVSNGSLVLNTDGTFTYTPNAGYNGNDTFTYEICDNGTPTECVTAVVTINVSTVNDAPVANDDAFTTDEDVVLSDNVLGNDNDPDTDPITVNTTPAVNVSNGTLVLNSNGDFTYTPDANFNGSDSFTYEICDGGPLCDQAVVTITVNPINDMPIASDDSFTTDEDIILTENVLVNDTDPENDNLILGTTPVVNVNNGTLVLMASGDFTYTPNADYNGSDSFTYEVCDDGSPIMCSQAVVTITILPVDDNLPPTAENLSITITANSDTTFCMNATDPDGDSLFISAISVPAQNGNATLSTTSALCIVYTPDTDFSGTDQVVVEICDGSACITATINIVVEPIPLNIYQALSPNNDNYNDIWVIDGILRYPDNEVKIFNRYGNLVFESKGYNNENVVWKGQTNSGLVLGESELPDGTYFYVINLGNDEEQLSGYVVLHR